jgi:hypothetical protein
LLKEEDEEGNVFVEERVVEGLTDSQLEFGVHPIEQVVSGVCEKANPESSFSL